MRPSRLNVSFVLFTLASAFPAPSASEEVAPRLAYWCAGLLSTSAPGTAVGQRLRHLQGRVAQPLASDAPFKHMLKGIVATQTDGDLTEAFGQMSLPALTWVSGRLFYLIKDHSRGKDDRFARQLVLHGRDAIREFLTASLAEAGRLERLHPAAGGTAPFVRKRRAVAKRAVETIFFGAGAYGLLRLTNAYAGDSPVPQVLAALMASYAVHQSVVSKARGVYLGLKNEWLLYRHRSGRREARPVERADVPIAHTRELLRRLDEPGGLGHTFAYAGYTVRVRLSLSTTTSGYLNRPAPAAAEIIAAERRSGDVRPPADARRVVVEQIFYVDPQTREPVLLVFVREPRYWIDSVR